MITPICWYLNVVLGLVSWWDMVSDFEEETEKSDGVEDGKDKVADKAEVNDDEMDGKDDRLYRNELHQCFFDEKDTVNDNNDREINKKITRLIEIID